MLAYLLFGLVALGFTFDFFSGSSDDSDPDPDPDPDGPGPLSFLLSGGDSVVGGDDADTFTLDPDAEDYTGISVDGGSGDDTVLFGSEQIQSASISGGDGNDVIEANAGFSSTLR